MNQAKKIKAKIKRSHRELWRLTKMAFVCIAVIFGVAVCGELALSGSLKGFSVGFLVGALLATINLHVLGWSLAPVIHGEKGAGLAVLGSLGSFAILGVCAFIVVWFFEALVWGFAFGFAAPVFVGLIYASVQK